MEPFTHFYARKRVLLTGHTGFKGTWLSIMLEKMAASVCGYSLPVHAGSYYKNVAPEIFDHVEGDITDFAKVSETMEQFCPDIVIHMASYSSLDKSMEIPDYILRTNTIGVLNVLEAVRKSDTVKAAVIVTSDKCYQNLNRDEAYTEESALGGKDPYSVSKVCQEVLSQCYRETFFENNKRRIGIATARASNIIGNGDSNISRLFPYLLDCYKNDRIPKIRHPKSIRSWQYVLDVLYGYLLLAKSLFENSSFTDIYDGAYNFGPEEDGFVTVGEVSERLARYFDKNGYCVSDAKDPVPKEAAILKLDSTKAKKLLNWQRRISMEDALHLIAEFAKRENAGETLGKLYREYVDRYMERL